MTTTEQKLTLAREALEEIKRDPDHFTVIHVATEALAAIATESAPAAGAASIDTEKLAEEFGLWSEQREKFVAHVAQQREAGRQDEAARILHLTHERDLALAASKKVEAELAQLREVVAYEQRHAARSEVALAEEKDRADRAEAALAQRAAGDDELPPLTMAGYGTREMLEQERQRRAQLAARAVGGVDERQRTCLETLVKELREQFHYSGAEVFRWRADAIETLLAATPAAPVGDGDERALYTCIGKGGEYELIGYSNGAGTKRGESIVIYSDTREKDIFYHRTQADFDARMQRIDRAALTQQKG